MKNKGSQRFAVRKRYSWKIFEQVVTVADLKKQQVPQETINTGIFRMKFAKFLRAHILKYISEALLLYLQAIVLTILEKDTANET